MDHSRPSPRVPAAAQQDRAGGTDKEDAFAATEQFAETQQMEDDLDVETSWWAEATDGQCSESAALFAASQPAPLSIV